MTLGKGAPGTLEVTFVDIDPAQERIAALFLGTPPDKAGRFRAADARAFLRGDAGGWEAIVVDRYSNCRTLPQHLLTAEFYRLDRSRLNDGGSLYVNHLTWPDDAVFRTRAARPLRSVFANCLAWPIGIERGSGWHEALVGAGNLLCRCRKSGLDGDHAIYSDSVPRPTWTARCASRGSGGPRRGSRRGPPAGPSRWSRSGPRRAAWRARSAG